MTFIKKEKNEELLKDKDDLLSARMKKALIKHRNRNKLTNTDEDDPAQYAESNVEDTAKELTEDIRFHARSSIRQWKYKQHPSSKALVFDDNSTNWMKNETSLFDHSNQALRKGISINSESPDTKKFEAKKIHAIRSIKASRKDGSGKKTVKNTSSVVSKISNAISSAAKNTVKDTGGLAGILAAGSSLLLVAIAIICAIGIIAGSPLGIFLSGEKSGSGRSLQAIVSDLNEDYHNKLSEIKSSEDYDLLDLSGSSAMWKDVLAVFAVKTTNGSDPKDVATIDSFKESKLREVFWEMNTITSKSETVTETETVEVRDEEDNVTEEEVEITRTILHITVSHKTALDMAIIYSFNESQMLQLTELLNKENDELWAAAIYGIYDGDDYLISSAAASRVGNFNIEVYSKGPMIWPLDSRYHSITSSFGFRVHPIKKTSHNHTGTDIGAPEGAEIYAVLPGTVTAAGEAGSYGNRVIIDHGGGVSTLYAHASRLLVSVGDTVEQGDTIALVGETGAATGPHLHIEVRINNEAQDAINFLIAP